MRQLEYAAVNSDDEWPDDDAEESDFDEELLLEAAEAERSKQRRSSGKHWTKSEFPEGSSKNNIMHAGNLEAALNWRCPCVDRNCLGAQRVNMVDIYKARQQFHSDVLHSLRDKARKRLEEHYDKRIGTFSRSFVVGDRGDCCAPAAGLAWGISFGTWAAARADLRKDAPLAAARRHKRKVKTTTSHSYNCLLYTSPSPRD